MHRPGIVFGVFSDIHDDFTQTAANATFLYGTTEPIISVPIGELIPSVSIYSRRDLELIGK